MDTKTTRVSPADVARQLEFCDKIAERLSAQPKEYLAFVDTYGCQQNEADSERAISEGWAMALPRTRTPPT